MSDNIAEHLKTLADKFSPLSDIWIKDIEVTDVLITDVTWTRAHSWAVEKTTDEGSVTLFHHGFVSPVIGFWQLLSRSQVESVKGLW